MRQIPRAIVAAGFVAIVFQATAEVAEHQEPKKENSAPSARSAVALPRTADGNALVIDTINFSEKTAFRGSSTSLHLVERLTRVDADTIEYRFTIDDPQTWTRPWTVAYPIVKTVGQIYEFACHEGNYGLKDILSGARWEEKNR